MKMKICSEADSKVKYQIKGLHFPLKQLLNIPDAHNPTCVLGEVHWRNLISELIQIFQRQLAIFNYSLR